MHNLQSAIKYLTFTLSFATIIGLVSPTTAQIKQSDFLEDLEIGREEDWQFSSESESASVKDDIRELSEYDLSSSEVELQRERTEKWGNKGDVEDFSIDFDVYEY